MSIETVTPAVIGAAILSIVLEWLPGVAGWFEALSSAKKTTINAALVALISGGLVLGNCYLWGNTCPANPWGTLGEILVVLLLASAGNQAVHSMTRRDIFA